MPTVLLVRHGQASFGGADYDVLSELGRRQAEIAGEALRREGPEIKRFVCGGLRRQRDTAAALGLGEPTVDRRWDEIESDDVILRHGDAAATLSGGEGGTMSSREFQGHLDVALAAWIAAGEDTPCRRSWPRFEAEATGALHDLAGKLGRGETAVAVTSAGVIALLAAVLLDSAETAFAPLNRVQVNTGISKIAIGARGATLVSLNDHSHLEAVDRSLVTYR